MAVITAGQCAWQLVAVPRLLCPRAQPHLCALAPPGSRVGGAPGDRRCQRALACLGDLVGGAADACRTMQRPPCRCEGQVWAQCPQGAWLTRTEVPGTEWGWAPGEWGMAFGGDVRATCSSPRPSTGPAASSLGLTSDFPGPTGCVLWPLNPTITHRGPFGW